MDYLLIISIAIVSQVILNITSDKIGYAYSTSSKWVAIILNVVIWIFLYERIGWTPTLAVVGIASTVLLASSFVDLKYQEIPNSYNVIVALMGGGFIYIYIDYYQQLILGGLIAFLLYFAVMAFTGAMGGGDVKMAGAIGLFMGTGLITNFIYFSLLSGAVIGLILLISKKKKKHDVFPFGPCIAFSGIFLFMFYI